MGAVNHAAPGLPLRRGRLVPGGRRQDAWLDGVVGWHAAFAALLALGAAAVVLQPPPPAGRALPLALLGVLAVGYALLVPPSLPTRHGWRPVAYVVLAIAVVGVAWAVAPVLSLLLFIVFPQMWFVLDDERASVAATVALAAACVTGSGVRLDWDPAELRRESVAIAVSTVFSLVLGLWMGRIIAQSEDRARLVAELEAARAALALAHHEQGVAAERERWAREVHDTIAQSFTSVVLLARRAGEALDGGGPGADVAAARHALEQAEESAREGLEEARALVAASAPVALDGATLADALRRLGSRFAAETGVDVEVEVAPSAADDLPREAEVVLLRAAQEALANVRKHARAGAVRLLVRREGGGAVVEVVDDGVGFTPLPTTGGYGLPGMRARVEQAGGRLDLDSAPGRGTRVRVEVPVEAAP